MYLISKPVNMDANNILTANLLDIIFEGKNKEYGAYELRKTYNKRVSISLVITLGVISLLLIASAIANNYSPDNTTLFVVPDIIVDQIPPVEPPALPPPPVLPPPPPVATIAFPPPVIRPDELVVKPPPEVEDLLRAHIDVKTVAGTPEIDFVAPPLEIKGTQVAAKPAMKKNDDSVFLSVEIEAIFPGGIAGWTKYVKRVIERHIDEMTENDMGTCFVKFIVDKNGKVSHVEATTMKGTKLAEIATNAIRNGPDWLPAHQNGSVVNAYRVQPITLKNPD